MRIIFYVVLLSLPSLLKAQQSNRIAQEQCATMERLQLKLARHPEIKSQFEQERTAFTNAVKANSYRRTEVTNDDTSRTAYTIPVVFHIVATNPNVVSDSTILAQLEILNKAFSGSNADTTRIPAYFKPLFGKSAIQFCLAQQTPAGQGTSGIERVKTTQTPFSGGSEAVKHAANGGADSWDTKSYYNVWLCVLSGDVLGYSTFPDEPGNADEQGVVIDYRSLPGGELSNYNTGKTLPHETGHYFNLYHIWGDDKGACTGTDYVDDTPNQADATKGCFNGIVTDKCTPDGNGIMYQNYMDYSFDSCLVMFTRQQVIRMESALIVYRSSLLSSVGCIPPVLKNYDARLSAIDQPAQRLCSSSFTPVVTIQNNGSQVLTSLDINTRIDNGSVTSYNWKGSLAYLGSIGVSLNSLSTSTGVHTLTIYISNPNNQTDGYMANDTISTSIQFYTPVASVAESFESTSFPPPGWDVVNPDNYITWKRVTGVSKTGASSVMIENFNYNSFGASDDLRLPNVTLQQVDSAFLSFQIAAATYSDPSSSNTSWDTLNVLASTDCGLTYASIYKKYGKDLVTRTGAITTSFVPTATEWRKDSINLANYIDKGNLLLAFRNTTGYENNIYLDDVNVRTVIINPNLKRLGFLATPNPTNGIITVQFYPPPSNLKGLQVYNITGQKLVDINVSSGQATNYYQIDITKYLAGTYVLRAVFTDRVITKKIMKF
ncbi:MAG: M43 family zinc metalloprotease [Bacteroidota bacterium]|nr:M43 family zinc metalloprotease [Bacteroidota bacterium]